jgi:hypothetical protein
MRSVWGASAAPSGMKREWYVFSCNYIWLQRMVLFVTLGCNKQDSIWIELGFYPGHDH